MKIEKVADLELTYTTLESLDFSAGGQLYGTMNGRLDGPRLSGTLELTNLAERRADNVNLPTLRGILRTDDGALVWVWLDGVATLRQPDNARVFRTTFRCRTGDERYGWLNTFFGVLDGVLDRVAVGGSAVGELFDCHSTVQHHSSA
ncbi:MAG: DUF3237 domain-containing protein [Chloroflexota bacterium]|nr:DUF3237 domain-containing protein [Chloroflexota bacterium]